MGKTIAFFDFDGTLTTKDSFLEAIKYQKGNFAYTVGFAVLLPVMVLYKLGIVPNWKAKEIVLKYFWGGMRIEDFQTTSENFALSEIPKILRKEAMERLQWHKSKGHRTVVVSASVSAWIKGWTTSENLELICSEMEVVGGKITGKLHGKNCYGLEKAIKIKSKIALEEYSEIYAYGDTKGDREMLALATHPYYRKFS